MRHHLGRYILGIILLFFVSLNAFATDNVINLYKEADNTSPVIQQLPEGVQVKVIASDQHKGYILIKTNDGQQGWVATDDVKNINNTTSPTDTPTNNTQDAISQIKSHSTNTVKYLANKSPDAIKDSQAYVSRLGKHYKQYLVDNSQYQKLFLIGAIVLAIGIMIGLFIGRLVWRKKYSYIR